MASGVLTKAFYRVLQGGFGSWGKVWGLGFTAWGFRG